MHFLLDTHALLWYLQDDVNLSSKARSVIDNEECYFSKVSLWEIAIKQGIGKLRYKKLIPEIVGFCDIMGFIETPVTYSQIEQVKNLPKIHGDPFDRLLISQAQSENFTIITRDTIIPQYSVKTLW